MAGTWTKLSTGLLGGGTYVSLKESTPNVQDKTLTPSDVGFSVLEIIRVRVEYTAIAAAAARFFSWEVQDSGADVVYSMEPSASITVTDGNSLVVQYDTSQLEFYTADVSPGVTPRHWIPTWTIHSGGLLRHYVRTTPNAADDMQLHVEAIAH